MSLSHTGNGLNPFSNLYDLPGDRNCDLPVMELVTCRLESGSVTSTLRTSSVREEGGDKNSINKCHWQLTARPNQERRDVLKSIPSISTEANLWGDNASVGEGDDVKWWHPSVTGGGGDKNWSIEYATCSPYSVRRACELYRAFN
ncbi:hypothetical protein J6590_039138 [Homalodisca vitripennis]|nr:hypothetical protein J6590_039138 [Homalodisca vitripennis]